MKRFLALFLTLALCLSVGLPVLAADEPGFTDVKESDYYYEAVSWAVENGVTAGVTDTEFGANGLVTRAQAVTFLWRLAGKPAAENACGFTDVPEGAWFADAVRWASDYGIVSGYSAERFAPGEPCTREQAATFLYRFEKLLGGGFTGAWMFLLDYTDRDSISDYAYEPLCWMSMKGVLQGYDGVLDPQGLCNRAQFVTMLCRYAGNAAETAEPAYIEKDVPVLRESLDSDETATLRYYEDMPNVPYMKLTDFYDRFYLVRTERTEGMTELRSGSRSVYTNFAGYRLTADAENDILRTDDFESFTLLGYYLELELKGEADEDYPFLSSLEAETEPETPETMTLRLCDYGIDLRTGEDGIYFPVGTLSDLFASATLYYVVYIGEKLYGVDDFGIYQDGNAFEEDDFGAPMADGRSADMTDFAYRELCFNLDSFYGRPGQEYIHEALEESTLDEVLSEQYPEIKAMLLSSDPSEYVGGMYHLFYGLLFDGGHTIPYSVLEGIYPASDEVIDALYDAPYSGILFDYLASYDLWGELSERRAGLYGDDYYVESGDTAMIRFDAFEVEHDGWKAFYNGEGELPLEGDTLGTIYAGLKRASSNPEIKNIVLDISCNGGGDTGAMNAIEWLMTGAGYLCYQNRLTGQSIKTAYDVDVNFDGVFDAQDQPFTNFRYGVLTSPYAFSCGNAFPFFMKAHGAMILGEKSSGGACCIRMSTTADGFTFYSSFAGYYMVTDEGESVDGGCPVDVNLTVEGDEPYADFYDMAAISAAMNAFFDGAENAA